MTHQFISFLGTNDYIPCNYYFENEKVENVTYIQTAVCKLFCKDFEPSEKITIFVTKEAYDKNGENLAREFEKFNLNSPEFVSIPSGKKEQELWELFEIVFNSLQNNAEIIFDITHSFRYIPMLSIVLLNYSGFVKNTEIQGIYYGALESLGNIKFVKELPINERNAPIFNLTPLATIQKWTIAVENLVQSGNTYQLEQTFRFIRKQHFTSTSPTTSKEEIEKGHIIVKNINEFMGDITTNRGLKLEASTTAQKLSKNLKNFDNEITSSSPLSPLLKINNELQNLISPFISSDSSIKRSLYAVELCLKYNLIQQGFTQLQELIITFACRKFGFDYLEYDNNRHVISSLLKVVGSKIPEEKWSRPLDKIDKNKLKKISETKNFKQLASLYSSLTDYRNDINHAGFNKNPINNPENFKKQLNKIYEKVKEIILREA